MAVRLRDAQQADQVIAVALGIGDDQVPTVLRIAEAKLTHLMALDHRRQPTFGGPQIAQQRSPQPKLDKEKES